MKKKIVSFFIAFFLFFFASISVSAQDEGGVAKDKGITVSPIRFEHEVDPGEVVEGEVKYYNNTEVEKTLYLRTLNFEAMGESGYPSFMLKDDLPYEESLKQWMTLESEQINVEPQTQDRSVPTIVKFAIQVPEDAAPGGHYAGIIQGLFPPGEEQELDKSGAVVSPESAAIVIVNVSGEVRKIGTSEEFYVTSPYLRDKSPIKFFEYPPVQFIARIRNDGNSHFKPQGNIFLYKGEKQIATIQVNEKEGNVLRNSIRKFEEEVWGDDSFLVHEEGIDSSGNPKKDSNGNIQTRLKINWNSLTKIRFGKFRAELNVVYDDEGAKKLIQDEVSFWIMPWKVLIVVLLIVISVVAYLLYRRQSEAGVNKYRK